MFDVLFKPRFPDAPDILEDSPPKISFLDLPREIRDLVYEEALIAKAPILVWLGDCRQKFRGSYDRKYDRGYTHTSYRRTKVFLGPEGFGSEGLAPNLLRSCRTIRFETAEIFYSKNIFCFQGYDAWDPLYQFLKSIGQYNRSLLRNIAIDLSIPRYLHVHTDGTLCLQDPLCPAFDDIVSRYGNRYFSSPYTHQHYAHEELYAIEACFTILGTTGPPLNLFMGLQYRTLPGLKLSNDQTNQSSLELSDLIEDFSQRLTENRILPKWRGSVGRVSFSENKALIEESWEILEASNTFPRQTRFLLQRRPLVAVSPAETPLVSRIASSIADKATVSTALKSLICGEPILFCGCVVVICSLIRKR